MIKYRTALVGGVFVLYLRTEYHTPASDWPLVIAKRTDRSTQCCFYFMFYKKCGFGVWSWPHTSI